MKKKMGEILKETLRTLLLFLTLPIGGLIIILMFPIIFIGDIWRKNKMKLEKILVGGKYIGNHKIKRSIERRNKNEKEND